MNVTVHVFEENFAREKCFEKSTSILRPVIAGVFAQLSTSIMKEFFTQIVQMIRLTARLYYIAKLY